MLTLFLQANIGESLLRGDHDYDKDIRDLGVIVKRIAEPNELKLPTLADFLHRVERGETASDLLQVSCSGTAVGLNQKLTIEM
jgi:hypothetical protein